MSVHGEHKVSGGEVSRVPGVGGGGQYMSQRSAAGTVQGLDILPVSAHRRV